MRKLWEDAVGDNIFVYQIFYSAETREMVDPYLIPLDNTENLRPDWYEFWVILQYLRKTVLHDDSWYGFLSPRFAEKSGFSGASLLQAIRQHRHEADIVRPAYGLGQMSFFVNVFEQGEFWHPGMTALARTFFARHGVPIDRLVTHTGNGVYSNYLIARGTFWRQWLVLAEDLWALAEARGSPHVTKQSQYGENLVDMKVFIQERIAPVLMATRPWRVLSLPAPVMQGVDSILFESSEEQLAILRELDGLKRRFLATGDQTFIREFFRRRGPLPERVES